MVRFGVRMIISVAVLGEAWKGSIRCYSSSRPLQFMRHRPGMNGRFFLSSFPHGPPEVSKVTGAGSESRRYPPLVISTLERDFCLWCC